MPVGAGTSLASGICAKFVLSRQSSNRGFVIDDRGEIEGRYSNHLAIGQNAFEFVFDFGQLYDGKDNEPRIHTRIITSPFYAKHISELLQSSIRRYEQKNGRIPNEP